MHASLNISNHFLQISLIHEVSDTRLFGQRTFGHSSFVSLITKSLTSVMNCQILFIMVNKSIPIVIEIVKTTLKQYYGGIMIRWYTNGGFLYE